jgi:hypothetical protein
VQFVIGERLSDENIHIGPSDYVPWQLDNKIAFIRVEGRLFGDVPMEIDVKLSVEDSPNSAGHRCHPLLQTCARSRYRWCVAFVLRLFFEASAGVNDRRRSVPLR